MNRRLQVEQCEARLLLATYVVDFAPDIVDGDVGPGELSVREAVNLANAMPGDDVIRFDAASLANSVELLDELVIDSNIRFEGPGASELTFNAEAGDPSPDIGDGSRLFHIQGGNVTISGLTLTGGDSSGAGGAILNEGRLTVVNAVISGNSARTGGGIANENVAMIDSSVISDNESSREGGAIHNGSRTYAELEIVSSTISGNSAGGSGGGVFDYSGGETELLDTQVIGNTSGGFGGGISSSGFTSYDYYYDPYTYTGYFYANPVPTELTIRKSTIADNASTASGGGIVSTGGAMTRIESSTISGNTSDRHGGGLMFYAGVAYEYGSLVMSNSTVSGNSASASGGGVGISGFQYYEVAIRYSTIARNIADANSDSYGDGGGLWVQSVFAEINHSIVAQNNVLHAGGAPDISSTTGALLFSLVGDNSGSQFAERPAGMGGSIVGGPVSGVVDPGLNDLGDYGGDTATHSLAATSVAIDAGFEAVNAPPEFDQRGESFLRIVNQRIDIGAVEYQGITVSGDFNNDGLHDCNDIDSLVANVAFGPANPDIYDLNTDGEVDGLDVNAWLGIAGEVNLGIGRSYLYGDANLDGLVDVGDFNLWNLNKFTTTGAWCSADFNADGNTDVSDFNLWNTGRFTSSLAIVPDWNPDQSAGETQLTRLDMTDSKSLDVDIAASAEWVPPRIVSLPAARRMKVHAVDEFHAMEAGFDVELELPFAMGRGRLSPNR